MEFDNDLLNFFSVHYSYLKLTREVKSTRVHAYSALLRWVNAFSLPGVGSKLDECQKARCYAKLALWKLQHCEEKANFDEKEIPPMIDHCKLAIEHNKDWQKAWHIWATIHYRVRSSSVSLRFALGSPSSQIHSSSLSSSFRTDKD